MALWDAGACDDLLAALPLLDDLDARAVAARVRGRMRELGMTSLPRGRLPTTRANLGALQNRFEHTINNLNVTVENLTASDSRIRDTDMAQEMTNFTRAQILTQAGTAMLAQANQAPQGILKLLG